MLAAGTYLLKSPQGQLTYDNKQALRCIYRTTVDRRTHSVNTVELFLMHLLLHTFITLAVSLILRNLGYVIYHSWLYLYTDQHFMSVAQLKKDAILD